MATVEVTKAGEKIDYGQECITNNASDWSQTYEQESETAYLAVFTRKLI